MTYTAKGNEQVAAYLNALDARIASASKDEAEKILKFSSDAANARLSPDLSDEARAELDYILREIGNRYFRLAGWLA